MDEMAIEGVGMTSRRARERLVAELRELGIQNEYVCQAMLATPRHLFLDDALSHRAYQNVALPIGHQQTISQPYVVARMTELALAERPINKVLEIGTGSGYQTAVLASFADTVFTVERIGALQRQAHRRLSRLGLRDVCYRHGDGSKGWPEHAPYDAIVVTAAASAPPQNLLDQLAEGGRLVMPVGQQDSQQLQCLVAHNGKHSVESVATVRFVPLVTGSARH